MRFTYQLVLSLLFVFLVACGRNEPPAGQTAADNATEPDTHVAAPTQETAPPDGHSSRTSLDWAGRYSGVLPCASCPGIETVVTLNNDGTFERSMLYIDESPIPGDRQRHVHLE